MPSASRLDGVVNIITAREWPHFAQKDVLDQIAFEAGEALDLDER
ncbi:MAG: hypothetical protein U5M50_10675 [Sphingobium sp.]|nr:hypothetical protein [Sphingobium sp.]